MFMCSRDMGDVARWPRDFVGNIISRRDKGSGLF